MNFLEVRLSEALWEEVWHTVLPDAAVLTSWAEVSLAEQLRARRRSEDRTAPVSFRLLMSGGGAAAEPVAAA